MSGSSENASSIADSDLQLLGRLPLFTGLAEELPELLSGRLEFHDLTTGERIIEQELRADSVIFLLDGEVAVNRDGKLVTLVPAPEVLGLVSILDNRPRTASLEAFSSTRLAVMKQKDFDVLVQESRELNRNLLAHLASKLRQQYSFSDRVQRHFDDFFRSPNAELTPGPYVAEPFDMRVFMMEEDPERLEALLPPGVRAMPGMGGRYLLAFNFFSSVRSEDPRAEGRSFSYNETAVFIPCLGPDLRPGFFVPELYPDNFLAITLGREIYGFPKRFARTRMDEARRTIDLVIARRVTMRATWSGESQADLSDLLGQVGGSWQRWIPSLARDLGDRLAGWLQRKVVTEQTHTVPIYVLKQSVAGAGTDFVDELVKIPFRVSGANDFLQLDGASVRLLDEDYFVGGHCVGAFRLEMALSFAARKIVRRYPTTTGTGDT